MQNIHEILATQKMKAFVVLKPLIRPLEFEIKNVNVHDAIFFRIHIYPTITIVSESRQESSRQLILIFRQFCLIFCDDNHTEEIF